MLYTSVIETVLEQMVNLRLVPHEVVCQHHVHVGGNVHVLNVQGIHDGTDTVMVGITEIGRLATSRSLIHRRIGEQVHVFLVEIAQRCQMESFIIIRFYGVVGMFIRQYLHT